MKDAAGKNAADHDGNTAVRPVIEIRTKAGPVTRIIMGTDQNRDSNVNIARVIAPILSKNARGRKVIGESAPNGAVGKAGQRGNEAGGAKNAVMKMNGMSDRQ
jgi:hypothetical protein